MLRFLNALQFANQSSLRGGIKMNKFLSHFGSNTNLVIWSGGLKVKKSFDVEVFDEEPDLLYKYE